MVLAVALIEVTPDRENDAYRTIKEINGIKNIYHIFVEDELLIIHESFGLSSLKQMLNDIRELKFVNAMRTIAETLAD